MSEPIIESSGNVFADLGFEEPEATILQMRAALMSDLRSYIAHEKMTESEAAARLGLVRARVTDLQVGNWEKFNLEDLITLEARIGRKVTLELA